MGEDLQRSQAAFVRQALFEERRRLSLRAADADRVGELTGRCDALARAAAAAEAKSARVSALAAAAAAAEKEKERIADAYRAEVEVRKAADARVLALERELRELRGRIEDLTLRVSQDQLISNWAR